MMGRYIYGYTHFCESRLTHHQRDVLELTQPSVSFSLRYYNNAWYTRGTCMHACIPHALTPGHSVGCPRHHPMTRRRAVPQPLNDLSPASPPTPCCSTTPDDQRAWALLVRARPTSTPTPRSLNWSHVCPPSRTHHSTVCVLHPSLARAPTVLLQCR